MRTQRLILALMILTAVGACGGGSGGVPAVPPVQGPIWLSGALSFDGVDDIAIAPASLNYFTFPAGMTFEAWIRLSALPGANTLFLGASGTSTLYLSGGGQGIVGFIVSTPATNTVVSAPGSIGTGSWQHVAGTYDGSTIRIYVDGVLVGSTPHTGTPTPFTDLFIGEIGTNNPSYFAGDMDEIRIWRVARTAAEIQAGMTQPVAANAPGLLAYYRCEGNDQTLIDSSAGNVDGGLGADPLLPDALDPTRIAPN